MSADIRSLPTDSRFLDALDALRESAAAIRGGGLPDHGAVLRGLDSLKCEWRKDALNQAIRELHAARDRMPGIVLLDAMLDVLIASREAAQVSYFSTHPEIRELAPKFVKFANDVIQSVLSFDFEELNTARIDRTALGDACAAFSSNHASSEVLERIESAKVRLGRYLANPIPSRTSMALEPVPEPAEAGEYAPSALARRFSVPVDALRKRLDRYREHNADGWSEATNRKPRESQYRYKLSVVKPIIMKLKADLVKKSAKRS